MQERIMICAAAVLILAVGSTQASLSNGGFEAGFTDWTTFVPAGASAMVVDSHTDLSGSGTGTINWGPTEGSSFALLKTDGDGGHTQLYQTFTASAGETLALDYFWDSQDFEGYNDTATGKVLSGAGTGGPLESLLFSHSVDTDPADYWGTPWTSVSHPFADAGTYTLLFEIWNVGDNTQDSYLGIDAAVVPVPGAVLLGMLGLSVAGTKLRKCA